MQQDIDKNTRCRAMVCALNERYGWRLTEEQQRKFVSELLPHLDDDCTDSQLQKRIEHYYDDHDMVHALQNRNSLLHDEAWRRWRAQATAILRKNGLEWSHDAAAASEDLEQVALTAMARALPTFHYTSRFSTWAYSVIVQSVRRYFRDQQASKRVGHTMSLDQSPEIEMVQSAARSEDLAEAQTLKLLIQSVLMDRGGARLAWIFLLSVEADMQAEEIGKRVQLSSSRVRVLLMHARQILRQHPGILAWRDADPQELRSVQ